mmetsp:Transcript_4165/g.12516  ORF Transcript_4165/g.12516 Transcript_4165/m.12516 type:complete len:621 (+) Transcript_4165:351-2213(+)|eukprot:CAMPEP_0198726504 /NCGR_PEP_ID=MMETSP1475-20131203/3529_1 /TAXON_ID= ORGANISM="Unidentified sp., Strain CCMP1999" /NCGR_SAMPLE_ID=MMETSP1475 /ASSEMBLY_ACC=CAM_ASM_001111 /LENGTH=620 /DNA_ID=CAMNT_0044488429 /DNA_START=301 /DNA_END=2163 /DNA_ORIENTATION=-
MAGGELQDGAACTTSAAHMSAAGSSRVAPESNSRKQRGHTAAASGQKKQNVRGGTERNGSRSKNANRNKSRDGDGDYRTHRASPAQHSRKSARTPARSRHESVPFSRERFVQANFTFCIKREGISAPQISTADFVLPWESIEMVLVNVNAVEPDYTCPVCLDAFSAPKMTPCGHIFCYLCMLQFLSYSSTGHIKCPLCAELVSEADLKSVEFRKIVPFKEDSEQTVRLLARPKTSMVFEAYRPSADDPKGTIPIYDAKDTPYSRLMFADEDLYLNHLLNEINQISIMVASSEDQMQMAAFADHALTIIKTCRNDSKRRNRNYRALTRALLADPKADVGSPKGDVNDGNSAEDCLKFVYQAETGEHIYLHPLNMKCLLREIEHYRSLPLDIHAKVLEIEWHVMNEENRKRFRFLSHLPFGCEFGLCELDLSNVLRKETLDEFAASLEKRREARSRRAKQALRDERDRQRSMQILKEFDSQHQAIYRSPLPVSFEHVDISDTSTFPSLGDIVSTSLTSSTSDQIDAGDVDHASAPSESGESSGISSYASITRNMGFYPSLNSGDQEHTSVAEASTSESFPSLSDSLRSPQMAGKGAWNNKQKTQKRKPVTLLSTSSHLYRGH